MVHVDLPISMTSWEDITQRILVQPSTMSLTCKPQLELKMLERPLSHLKTSALRIFVTLPPEKQHPSPAVSQAAPTVYWGWLCDMISSQKNSTHMFLLPSTIVLLKLLLMATYICLPPHWLFTCMQPKPAQMWLIKTTAVGLQMDTRWSAPFLFNTFWSFYQECPFILQLFAGVLWPFVHIIQKSKPKLNADDIYMFTNSSLT